MPVVSEINLLAKAVTLNKVMIVTAKALTS